MSSVLPNGFGLLALAKAPPISETLRGPIFTDTNIKMMMMITMMIMMMMMMKTLFNESETYDSLRWPQHH